MRIKKRGDTIIEVMMAIAVFAIISVITIDLMNDGINSAQRTLEMTMARNEIDGQAEALRYIHQSYVAERQLSEDESQYRKLWNTLRGEYAIQPKQLEDTTTHTKVPFDINSLKSCDQAYDNTLGMVRNFNAFVLNTRLILPDSGALYDENEYDNLMNDIIVGVNLDETDPTSTDYRLVPATLYPRIVYGRHIGGEDMSSRITRGIHTDEDNAATNDDGSLAEKEIYNRIARAEGIFIIAVGDKDGSNNLGTQDSVKNSNYFDFYIRTCWHSVGSVSPSTITTIVRLYNPEVIE